MGVWLRVWLDVCHLLINHTEKSDTYKNLQLLGGDWKSCICEHTLRIMFSSLQQQLSFILETRDFLEIIFCVKNSS